MEVVQPAGEKGEAEKNKGEVGIHQMKLYPQGGLIVMHGNEVSYKEKGQKIKGKEGTGQDQTQWMVRAEIKETVKNPRVRLGREEERISTGIEESGRTSLDNREGGDRFLSPVGTPAGSKEGGERRRTTPRIPQERRKKQKILGRRQKQK